MLSNKIRREFLNYFKKQGHSVLPSSPTVPHEDPTLLFTNAGMNQFKDVFLGKSARDYTRAATSQKCIRVGGKHNDLDNVGHTRRHLTLFEMLGNFSFGDYFKEDAIRFAWEVTTNVFNLDPKHVWASVFTDDDEAFELWTKWLPAEKIVRFGEKENFWSMGDTGPCGPCSELLFDRGPGYGDAPNPTLDPDGERYFEFWNLVFMQYNKQASGEKIPLPKPSIDTGAGLERIAALKLGCDNVFETDILREIIAQTEKVTGKPYDTSHPHLAPAFRVIADHIRCLAFAIADGAQPSNVDRGYVLRKVLRRAVRYGKNLGMNQPFLALVLPRLVSAMGDDYPELKKSEQRIAEILTQEEEAFFRTLKRGGNLLTQVIEKAEMHGNSISGDDAFKLKDTYGLPLEEIVLLAKDAGLVVDLKRFQEQEELAKERSRSAQKNTQQLAEESLFEEFVQKNGPTEFVGYTATESNGQIKAIVKEGAFSDKLEAGDEGIIILDKTPFYAEMGGQVGDSGKITETKSSFIVNDCQALFKGLAGHFGKVERGTLKIGDKVLVTVDPKRRLKITNNHTATHLLHWALHEVLGPHVKQAGSVVDETRLRFDFTHHKALTNDEIRRIEDLVNEKVQANTPVKSYEMSYDQAQKESEIKQFFGDKYGSRVRVVEAFQESKELCGGTHTSATGNIGFFRISEENGIAAGTRRIEAVTGDEALILSRKTEDLLTEAATVVKATPPQLVARLEKLIEENKEMQNQLKKFRAEGRRQQVEELAKNITPVKGTPLLVKKVDCDVADLKILAEETLEKVKSGVIVLGCIVQDKGHLFVRISDDMVAKGIKAQELIQKLAPLIEGSGGGKPGSAQAGGKAPDKLQEALNHVGNLLP